MPSSKTSRLTAGLVPLMIAASGLMVADRAEGSDQSPRKTPVVLAVRRVMPSVVSISSEKKAGSTSRWPFSAAETQQPRVNGMGTGVIIDARGYILTNQHVVDKVQTIEVHLSDASSYLARVIQVDKEMDLALVKIEAGRPLSAVSIGSSADLEAGETVITIGNAFGYENTVSVGIVSQLKRNVTLSDEQVYRNLIQTDACINPGNSGGPLINIQGELVGINVATRSGAQGIGFALPIDDVKRVTVEMFNTRKIAGTWHGLVVSEVAQGDDRKVVVRDVQPNSPAAEAGLVPGDLLSRVGDLDVTNPIDVERGLLDARPGQPSRISLVRAGKPSEVAIDVKPASRLPVATAGTADDPGDQIWQALGIRMVPVQAEYVKAASGDLRGGLFVQSVTPNSPAAKANIQRGDILVGVNVGDRHWETIRPDTVLYTLRQPEIARTQSLPFYIVRKNNIHQGEMSIAQASASRTVTPRR